MRDNDNRPTVEEVLDNATGYDERDTVEHFGVNIETSEGIDQRPRGFLRALVFMHKRHNGTKTAQALAYANNLTAVEVSEFFAEDTDAMPDEPDSAAGKDA